MYVKLKLLMVLRRAQIPRRWKMGRETDTNCQFIHSLCVKSLCFYQRNPLLMSITREHFTLYTLNLLCSALPWDWEEGPTMSISRRSFSPHEWKSLPMWDFLCERKHGRVLDKITNMWMNFCETKRAEEMFWYANEKFFSISKFDNFHKRKIKVELICQILQCLTESGTVFQFPARLTSLLQCLLTL